jgi:tetratricopeptide (TPR) repeat protein
VIGFALNARVRQGDLEKAGELFGLIEQLGGDITRSTMAVYRLVSVTKPQIEDLKKQNKSEEATKLATAVATLVSQIAAKPNLTTEMNYNLGRAFKDLGDYPKAIEMLTKVPKPEDPGYFGNPASADPEEQKKRLAAQMYRNAQLELVQSYVLAKDFAKAEELLEAALGKDPEAIIPNKPNKNWGYRFVEFRKERFRALEAKASTMEIKASTPIWVEAKKGWERIQLEYQNSITRWTPRPPTDLQLGQMAVGGILIYVGPAKEENDRLINTIIKPRYYDAMFEALRCRTDALVYTTKSLPPASQIAPITRVAETIMNVERNSVDMPDEVIAKYQDLMSRLPVLLGEYTKLGGTKFLPKPMMMP